MSKKQSPGREYNFPDTDLKKTADRIIGCIQRDRDQFSERGFTDAKLLQVKGMVNDFADIPSDVELLGALSKATQKKDVSAENARIQMRSVRTMAHNAFGVKSPSYRSFGFENMDSMSDEQLFFHGKRVIREATAQLQELASEGLTGSRLEQLQATLNVFEKDIQDKEAAEKQRDARTQERVNAGNALFREISRLGNTGKDIWASTDEARYNDYVIYNTASPSPKGNTGLVGGTLTDFDTGEELGNVSCCIEGIGTIVVSEDTGDFLFENIPSGTFVLLFTRNGYTDLRKEGVVVAAGKETVVDGMMKKKG
ncbi:MAG: carboxypeptidase-like regulatory domain-containing protein [Bacteroidota bacterium]